MVVSLALVYVNSGDTAHAGMLTMHKQWNHFLIDHCNVDYKCILTLSRHFDPQCDNRYLPKSCYTHTTPWPCILYPLAMHTLPPGHAYSTPWPCILYPLAMHTLPPGHAYFTPWPCILHPLAMYTPSPDLECLREQVSRVTGLPLPFLLCRKVGLHKTEVSL